MTSARLQFTRVNANGCFTSLFYREGTGAGKHHFGSPPSSSLVLGTYQPISWLASAQGPPSRLNNYPGGDPAPPTSGLALALSALDPRASSLHGPGTQPLPQADLHLALDSQGHAASQAETWLLPPVAHEWASRDAHLFL